MERKIFSQAKFLAAEAIVGLLTGLLLLFLMSRIRGQVFIGQYAIFTTWTAIFQIFARLGASDLILRETGKKPEQAGVLIGAGLLVCSVSSILAIVAMNVTIYVFQYSNEMQTVLTIASLMLVPVAISSILKSGFIVQKETKKYFFIVLFEFLTIFLFNGYFIINHYGIIYLIKTILFVKTASTLILLYVLNRSVIKIKWGIHFEVIRTLLGPLFSFSMIQLSVIAFWRVDILMLSKMTTVGIVGIYVVASKFLEVFSFIPNAFAQTVFPHISRELSEKRLNQESLAQAVEKLFFIVAPISIAIFIFSKPIIITVFGDNFVTAAPALKIFMLTFVILTADMVMSIIYEAAGYQRNHMYISMVIIVANIGMNFLLIPSLSFFGASLATLFSVTISSVLHYYLISRQLFRIKWELILMKPLALGLVLAAPIILLNNKVHFVPLGVGYTLLYGLIFYKFFSERRKEALEKI